MLTRVQTQDLPVHEFIGQLRGTPGIHVPVLVPTEAVGSAANLHNAGASAVILLLGNMDDLLRVLAACIRSSANN